MRATTRQIMMRIFFWKKKIRKNKIKKTNQNTFFVHRNISLDWFDVVVFRAIALCSLEYIYVIMKAYKSKKSNIMSIVLYFFF